MLKKVLSLTVLTCLVLHCSARLGLLSYLYEQRHEIAYAIGLKAAVPIAMCNSSYFAEHSGLVIKVSADHESLPPVFSHVSEIGLYCPGVQLTLAGVLGYVQEKHSTPYILTLHNSPGLDFFQPPRIVLA